MADSDSASMHLLILLAFHKGLVTAAQLQSTLEEWLGQEVMGPDEILLARGYISEDDFVTLRQMCAERLERPQVRCQVRSGFSAMVMQMDSVDTTDLRKHYGAPATDVSRNAIKVSSKLSGKKNGCEIKSRQKFYREYYRDSESDSLVLRSFYYAHSIFEKFGHTLDQSIRRAIGMTEYGSSTNDVKRIVFRLSVASALALIVCAVIYWSNNVQSPRGTSKRFIVNHAAVQVRPNEHSRPPEGEEANVDVALSPIIDSSLGASAPLTLLEQRLEKIQAFGASADFDSAIALIRQISSEETSMDLYMRNHLDEMLIAALLGKGDTASYAEIGGLLASNHNFNPSTRDWKLLFACWLIYATEDDRLKMMNAINTWGESTGDRQSSELLAAWVLARSGKPAESTAWLAINDANHSLFPSVLYYAVALYYKGNKEEAKTQIDRARSMIHALKDNLKVKQLRNWRNDVYVGKMLQALDRVESQLTAPSA